ncbi:Crp/Fnr family transcriptional regulator [Kordiimonas sp. SCSIO 12603]|uniref:Crp/Fnr family transcriptional regulator n=1 Tax=Kordiimonas sp. SCSIO 12603 TaxID=2829596 RepID=UPI002102497C|nr:Crp/Fnr family transcriptional regulator [Kordiimonas sp. SCSIO 12603]UTW59329.1 Crp/Fnr family transcriptional regulator [Kordiimonas sp. SCSIO 12603]
MRDILANFFGTSSAMLNDIEQKSTRMVFNPGETIFSQEEEGNTVFFVLTGKVKAVLYSNAGEEVWLDEFGSGTLFGEMAVLSAQSRTADIVASTRVELAAFSAACFLDLMENHGSVGLAVSKMLADRVHKTTQRMYELTAVSAKGRVHAELLRLARRQNNQLLVENIPAYTVLAKRINSTRETVSRTVNELVRKGAVEKKGSDLIILDRSALKRKTSWVN